MSWAYPSRIAFRRFCSDMMWLSLFCGVDNSGFVRPVICTWCMDDADEDEEDGTTSGSANAVVGKGEETTGEEVSEGVLRAWLRLRPRSAFSVERCL